MTVHAAGSNPGRKRDHNEDAYLARPELGLWLVADGVGGHSHGEVASALVRRTIAAGIEAGDSLLDAVKAAHRAVLDAIEAEPVHAGMGSTVVALHVTGNDYDLVWVGDSRAYLWDGELHQLSRDHKPVSELVRHGVLTEEEAERHPGRHVLSQSLGVNDQMELDPGHLQGTLNPGDRMLLCSDGLNDEIDDDQIGGIISHDDPPQTRVDALIEAALAAGGHDNITVVLVEFDEKSRAADSGAGSRAGGGAGWWLAAAVLLAIAAAAWLLL